jgi:serine/threonine protein kinase
MISERLWERTQAHPCTLNCVRGAFSEVKKAVCRRTNGQFAIKIIDRSKCVGKENMIQSEISILKRVRHDNIIQLYELFETEHKIYLVMELYPSKHSHLYDR